MCIPPVISCNFIANFTHPNIWVKAPSHEYIRDFKCPCPVQRFTSTQTSQENQIENTMENHWLVVTGTWLLWLPIQLGMENHPNWRANSIIEKRGVGKQVNHQPDHISPSKNSSMDWFKGKIYRKPQIFPLNMGFSCKQFISRSVRRSVRRCNPRTTINRWLKRFLRCHGCRVTNSPILLRDVCFT